MPLIGRLNNHLLSQLSEPDLTLLDLEPIELRLRQVIEARNTPIKHVYFVEHGLISVVAATRSNRLEVGLVGCEGMTGVTVLLGNDRSPNETFVQVAGRAHRIPTEKLKAAMEQSRALARPLLHFACSFMNQTSNTAFANGTANVQERLARWLLMAHDRMRGDEIPLTHDLLASMLAVRRAGVTVALRGLAKEAAVTLSRGQIIVVDRQALKIRANGGYRELEPRPKSRS